MGLRFRKSISIMPGMRLNFGKSGMSLSAGVPGFRKTFHSSGKVTTSIGIPGTGLYYTDTKKSALAARSGREAKPTAYSEPASVPEPEKLLPEIATEQKADKKPKKAESPKKTLSAKDLVVSICKVCDDTIDWTDALVYELPPDENYNADVWKYYHSVAKDVLRGDIDTYLKLIYEINPLDDLLEFAKEFQFGSDNSHYMEVEYKANESALSDYKNELSQSDYNLLLQDLICSVSIRIARDMFALLPVRDVVVHSVLDEKTVLSVKFDRSTTCQLNFGYLDPSDTVCKFRNNMRFDENSGFSAVSRISGD